MQDFSHMAASLPDPFRLLVRESSLSTNDDLREMAQNGAPEGLILLAHRQTAGRGRRGAAWFSPPGESLAFSILVRPSEPKALWPRLALAAGLAVAEAIESFGLHAGIKWPNDVWINHRKVAGILVEAGHDFAIVGIGMNVSSSLFPPEVADIATSLHIESGRAITLPEVLGAVASRFAARHHQIGAHFPEIIRAVRLRCVLSGHRVSLLTAHGPRHGIIEGIADSGELILRDDHRTERLLQADEIRILGDS